MASVNKVIIIGNLGADPENRFAPSGDAICNLRIATTESWRDKATGDKKEATEWHRVVFYGKLAEIAGQYLKKGSQVYIEGSLRTRKWQDQSGQDRYTTEIRGDEMKMLGGRGEGSGSNAPTRQAPQRQAPQQEAPQQQRHQPPQQQPAMAGGGADSGFGYDDNDIPFSTHMIGMDVVAKKHKRIFD